MVSTFNVATAAAVFAAACYFVVGVVVVNSARGNSGGMGWRDRLGLVLAFVAAPLLVPVVGVAALMILIDSEEPVLHVGAKSDEDRDLAQTSTPSLLSGKRREQAYDLSLDSVVQV